MGLSPSRPLLLFFGSMTYAPNRQAVDNLQRHIIPNLKKRLSEFTVAVAGAGLEEAEADTEYLRVLGFVDDLVALIKSADLVVVPLSAGSGTRFKIVESVACGKRVVSTSIGAEGLDRNVFGDRLHIADDWREFAGQVAQLAQEKSGIDVPQAFIEKYDWHHILDRLEAPVMRR
jgi:glycosyltransferase involved in cell wall biosynthesis